MSPFVSAGRVSARSRFRASHTGTDRRRTVALR